MLRRTTRETYEIKNSKKLCVEQIRLLLTHTGFLFGFFVFLNFFLGSFLFLNFFGFLDFVATQLLAPLTCGAAASFCVFVVAAKDQIGGRCHTSVSSGAGSGEVVFSAAAAAAATLSCSVSATVFFFFPSAAAAACEAEDEDVGSMDVAGAAR